MDRQGEQDRGNEAGVDNCCGQPRWAADLERGYGWWFVAAVRAEAASLPARHHGLMRELIYVSQAKLRQLVPDLPGRSGRLRDVEGEVKTPLGGFKVGKAARETGPGLARVVAALEASPRAPKWFADPEVRPGQWVHFEAPLSYAVTGSVTFFLDSTTPSTAYPTGGRLRLLLHGSEEHLVGAPPMVGFDRSYGPLGSRWNYVIETLNAHEQVTEETAFDVDRRDASGPPQRLMVMVNRVSEAMQTEFTAAWMGGYARVTALYPRGQGAMLAATPLYVEYIDPPENPVVTT